MKLIGRIRLIGVGVVFSLNVLHGQTSTVTSAEVASVRAGNLAAMVAAVAQTTPTPPESIPGNGTFYSAQNPQWPPFPGNVNNLAAWSLGEGVYLLADLDFDYEAQAQAQGMRRAMDDGPPIPGGGGVGGSGGDSGGGTNYFGSEYPTNGLFLEITNVAAGLAYLNLHNATNQVYAIWTATNLPGSWNVETEVWPTNGAVLPFSVPTLERQSLFLRAEDWTGVAENGNTTPDWWFWAYFGTVALSDTNLDSQGNTLLYDYTNGIAPTTFQFTAIATANNNFNTGQVPAQLVVSGRPYWMAILVDDTNFADANWTAFTSSNITVNLGLTEGWHDVWIGLRGHADDPSAAVWQWKRLKLDFTPPLLVVTNPLVSTVSVPLLQVQGYSPEALQHISYDLANAAGLVTNQDAGITGQFYSTNTWEFTTNYFKCVDVPLTNGLNLITLHATDLAGHTTTASYGFTLDYSSRTNPPVVQLYWPQDGTLVCNGNYTWRGWADDPTATVTAQLVDTNGDTNIFQGIMERTGNFWVENLPLSAGTNFLTLTVTDSAGNVAVTNITVAPGAVALTIDPVAEDLWNLYVNVTGTISDWNDYTVWVNGVKATLNGDGTWAATNVYLPAGGTALLQARAIPNTNNGGTGTGGSGGGPATYANLGNPDSPAENDAESQTNKPAEIRQSSDYYDFAFNSAQYNGDENVLWYPDTPYHIYLNVTWNYPGDVGWEMQDHSCPPLPESYYDGENDAGEITIVADENGTLTTNLWPGLQPWFTGSEHCQTATPCPPDQGIYRQKAQSTFQLLTGGKSNSHQQNLFQISGSAVQYPAFSAPGSPKGIPSQDIYIMGQPLGADGYLYKVLPDNDARDVTPYVAGVDYYTFTLGQQKYHPYITLSTATTNANLDTDTPEVCVGQQVTLSLNGLPPYQEQVGHWTLPQKYVNEPWQLTNWVVTPPLGTGYWAPYGSVNYRINPDLKTNLTTQCWYVNKPGGTVTAAWNLQFSNGQQVDVITRGAFTVYRPTVAQWDPLYLGPAQVVTNGGTLALGGGTAAGMSFRHYPQSTFSGTAGYTQLISGEYDSDLSISTDGYELDNTEWARGQKAIHSIGSWSQNGVPFDDEPHIGLANVHSTTAMDLLCNTYLRFMPDGGSSIFVTLRLVTWGVTASATKTSGVWTVDLGSSPSGPADSDSDAFPIWTETFTNSGL